MLGVGAVATRRRLGQLSHQELRHPPDRGPEVQPPRDHTDMEGLDGSSARQQAAPCGKPLHTARKGVIQRPLSLVKTLGMQMG